MFDRLSSALATRYCVDRELGAGGMATVYLAHDLKHEREVAIKVLHPDLGAALGGERFLAEIKTTAKLQHPHILPLLDSGEADGLLYYVMPFVRGETLRARLERERQLAIADAVRIAREVAGALEHAHKQGIIHRDIKPENILLQDGAALVADFGIALAVQTAGGARMTQTGLSLGTPSYMSPEQAMGERAIDARSDQYALAAVLYEMLVGTPPFAGATTQAIVARILTERPPTMRAVRDTVSEALEAAVLRALAKLPADRFPDVSMFAAACANDEFRHATATGGVSVYRFPMGRVLPLTAVTAIVATAIGVWFGSARAAVDSPLRLGMLRHVSWERDLEVTPALSPDGRQVAYGGGRLPNLRVMVRTVEEGRPIPLTGDSTAVESDPQWSPDGTRILFLSRGGVYSAPSGGGPARPEVAESGPSAVTSATWGPDGRQVAFARADSIFVRSAEGQLKFVAEIVEASLCRWAPVGDWVACTSGNVAWSSPSGDFGNRSASRIVLVSVTDGRTVTVTDSATQNLSPTWSRNGDWLYFLSDRAGESDVYGIHMADLGNGVPKVTRLTTGIGAHTIDLSRDGSRLAVSRYANRNSIWSLRIPATGMISSAAAMRVTNATETIESFGVDQTGEWIVYDSNRAGSFDLFKAPIAGGEPLRLTSATTNEFAPTFTPDGQSIVFHALRDGNRELLRIPAAGGAEERLTRSQLQEMNPIIAPDGSAIAVQLARASQGIAVLRRSPDGRWSEPRVRLDRAWRPNWSPDGASIGFVSASGDGTWQVMPTDSGVPRTVYRPDAASGNARAVASTWTSEGPVFLLAASGSDQKIVELDPQSGRHAVRVEFDRSLHEVYARVFRVVRRVLYFLTETRESDVWVVEVGQP